MIDYTLCNMYRRHDKFPLPNLISRFSLKEWKMFRIDTIQDFLCKLGMKPHMHLVEISIFSLNHVITRPIKIIKDLCKAST